MRHKCSPLPAPWLPAATILLLAISMAACGGSRAATDTDTGVAEADTLATSADTSIVQTPVPTSLPRVPTRIPRSTPERTPERPAYAQIQEIPNLSEAFREQFGIADAAEWSSSVAQAIVSLGPCSGALVSRDGLVVTSSSCLHEAVQAAGATPISGPEEPFSAAPGNERTLDGITVHVVRGLHDVSDRLSTDTLRSEEDRREALRLQLLGSADGDSVALLDAPDGALFAAVYASVDDVRLVFRPEEAVWRFGGTLNERTYPQARFDVTFLRLMHNGQPLQTPVHLNWAARTPRRGIPVFAAGSRVASTSARTGPIIVAGGQVRGYREGPMPGPPVVPLYTMFDQHFAFGGRPPWALPDSWLDARSALTLATPLTLAATAEWAPGMRGGPLLGMNLDFLGTICDANLAAAGSDTARRRQIVVTAQAVEHVLGQIYDAPALLAELRQGIIPD